MVSCVPGIVSAVRSTASGCLAIQPGGTEGAVVPHAATVRRMTARDTKHEYLTAALARGISVLPLWPMTTIGIVGGTGLYDLDGLVDRQRPRVHSPFAAPPAHPLPARL